MRAALLDPTQTTEASSSVATDLLAVSSTGNNGGIEADFRAASILETGDRSPATTHPKLLPRQPRSARLSQAVRRQSQKNWKRTWQRGWLKLNAFRHRQRTRVARRCIDLVVASAVALLTSPLWTLVALVMLITRTPWVRLPRYGQGVSCFDEYRFPIPAGRIGQSISYFGIDRIPLLINLLRGEMTLVGPRPLSSTDAACAGELAARRFDDKPGVVCLWWVRKRANIDYESEWTYDLEYVEGRTLRGDLGILCRAAVSICWGVSRRTESTSLNVLGNRVDNITMTDAIETLVELASQSESSRISFMNADCANRSVGNPEYRRALRTCRLTLGDGIGIKLAGRILNQHLCQNVNGTDLFPRLCERISTTGHRLYLLGAQPGIAEGVADWIAARYPKVQLAGTQHGYFDPEQTSQVLEAIRLSRADILLVAMGAPTQDLWLERHVEQTGCRVGIGVGGLFDYYSGRIPRAPQWVRELCLEWAFRFYQEPGRLWRRYWIGNAIFLMRVVRQRLARSTFLQSLAATEY